MREQRLECLGCLDSLARLELLFAVCKRKVLGKQLRVVDANEWALSAKLLLGLVELPVVVQMPNARWNALQAHEEVAPRHWSARAREEL